jgi:hypothetical protein
MNSRKIIIPLISILLFEPILREVHEGLFVSELI